MAIVFLAPLPSAPIAIDLTHAGITTLYAFCAICISSLAVEIDLIHEGITTFSPAPLKY